MNLGQIVTRSAAYWPDAPAAKDVRRCLSFSDLEVEANRLCTGLMALGYPEGSHVAIQAPNCSELVAAEVAFYKGGMVKVPINARLSAEETVHVVNDSHARVLIGSETHAKALTEHRARMPKLERIVTIRENGIGDDLSYTDLLAKGRRDCVSLDPTDDALAVLHYTSGSSGVLKAAMQSYGNRRALLRKNLIRLGGISRVGSKMGHVGPITHASGMSILPMLYIGGCNYLFERFDIEEVLAGIERERITRIFFVPTMVTRILDSGLLEKYDLSSLIDVSYGAAPMPPSVVERAMEAFGPILTNGYGLGETTSTVTVLTPQDHSAALQGDRTLLTSCGRSYFECEILLLKDDGTEAEVGELGEICVRGPDIMQGYWNAPELTAEVLKDGIYHTGDIGRRDENGYIYIVDRKKEMIISGGFNVYPSEVERVLYRHPEVFEAAVVGVPDSEWGEVVKAVVVRRKEAELSEAELLEFCRQVLPGFKRPCSVDFVDELPRNPNGKIVRRQVRDAYWTEAGRKV